MDIQWSEESLIVGVVSDGEVKVWAAVPTRMTVEELLAEFLRTADYSEATAAVHVYARLGEAEASAVVPAQAVVVAREVSSLGYRASIGVDGIEVYESAMDHAKLARVVAWMGWVATTDGADVVCVPGGGS